MAKSMMRLRNTDKFDLTYYQYLYIIFNIIHGNTSIKITL